MVKKFFSTCILWRLFSPSFFLLAIVAFSHVIETSAKAATYLEGLPDTQDGTDPRRRLEALDDPTTWTPDIYLESFWDHPQIVPALQEYEEEEIVKIWNNLLEHTRGLYWEHDIEGCSLCPPESSLRYSYEPQTRKIGIRAYHNSLSHRRARGCEACVCAILCCPGCLPVVLWDTCSDLIQVEKREALIKCSFLVQEVLDGFSSSDVPSSTPPAQQQMLHRTHSYASASSASTVGSEAST